MLLELPTCLAPRTPAKLWTRQAVPKSRQCRQTGFRVAHPGCPFKPPKRGAAARYISTPRSALTRPAPAAHRYQVPAMTPEQALRTATTNAAELLGKEKELGAVAPGYFGDLVAVEGDPLADINVAINNC